VAVPGLHVDGHDFVAAAGVRGAAAALVERPVLDVDLPQLVVTSTRHALATAAAWWYADPSEDLGVVGITGTDGKTTTSFLAVAALEAAGLRTGMTGTAETRIGGIQAANEAHATTPEAPALQAALRAMVGAGDVATVIETTSHGLALGRVDSVAYDVAILTNLTHEHLELHGSWDAYRDAKLSLFERLAAHPSPTGHGPERWPKTGIVNLDDPSAGAFVGVTQEAGARTITYGTDPAADVRATRWKDAHRLRIRYGAVGAASVECGSPVGSTYTTRSRWWHWVRPSGSTRPRCEPGSVGASGARADGADRTRSTVRRDRGLRPQPGIAAIGPRPARSERCGPWRRPDRGVRLGR
jgi:UDP-N-acetylmuramyl tripeptide synthase